MKNFLRTVIAVSSWLFFLGALLVWSQPTTAVFATPDLPPRPTLIPTAVPTPLPTPPPPAPEPEPEGATIMLHAPGGNHEMWAIVQWGDALGGWHDVTGWQGHLRHDLEPRQLWWVSPTHFNDGPFRWQIFATETGPLLTTTAPFHLPAAHGQIVTIPAELP